MAKKLTREDEDLILACKVERDKLKKQYEQLSDKSLAHKFDVSTTTIKRVQI